MLQLIMVRAGLILVALAAIGGAGVVGKWLGRAEVRAAWAAAAETQRQKEEAVRGVVEDLGMRFAVELRDALATTANQVKEVADAGREAESQPVDPACRDVRRGLPADVLRRLDQVR